MTSALQRKQEPEPRLCACGCGTELEGRANRLYASKGCKMAAYKARTGYRLVAVRKRPQSPKRREPRPSDVRPTYRAMVAVLEEQYESWGIDAPHTVARATVRRALTNTQRSIARELGL